MKITIYCQILKKYFFLSCIILSTVAQDNLLPDPDNSLRNENNIDTSASQDLVQPSEENLVGVPHILEQPRPEYYVSNTQSAEVSCVAEPVSHAVINCNGVSYVSAEEMASDAGSGSRPDAAKRVNVEKLNEEGTKWRFSVKITRGSLRNWLDFECHCEAWHKVPSLNRVKMRRSQSAKIIDSYMSRNFIEVPVDITAEAGGRDIMLSCVPPEAKPKPDIHWLKDGVKIVIGQPQFKYIVFNAYNNLIIQHPRKEYSGNYTCVATNLGNKKTSPPAKVNIFVNGEWSSWKVLSECPSGCEAGMVCRPDCITKKQVRQRQCNNPPPYNGGSQCRGDKEETVPCFAACRINGAWTVWSNWSYCDLNCRKERHRTCTNPAPQRGGSPCLGESLQIANCSANECSRGGMLVHHDAGLYIGICFGVGIFVTILILIFLVTKRRCEGLRMPRGLRYPVHGNGNVADKEAQKMNKHLLPLDITQQTSVTVVKNHNAVDPSSTSTSSPSMVFNNMANSFHMHPNGGTMGRYPPKSPVPSLPISLPNPNGFNIPWPLTRNSNNISNNINNNNNNMTYTTIPPDHVPPSSTYMSIDNVLPPTSSIVTSNGYNNNRHLKSLPPRPTDTKMSTSGGVSPQQGSNNIGLMTTSNGSGQQASSALYHELSLGREMIGGCLASFIPSNLDMDCVAWGNITAAGGRLCLPASGISLTIPQGALPNGASEEMFLAVMRDTKDHPSLPDRQTLLTPVVMCGPPHIRLLKSATLSVPHCASLEKGGWQITVASSAPTLEVQWQEMACLGRETLNTPIYCQLDANSAHLMIDQFQRFCLVGESLANGDPGLAQKNVRLAAFSGPLSAALDCTIRVYVVPDTRDALEAVVARETIKLGGKLLDSTKQLTIRDGGRNLCFCIEELNIGWRSRSQNKSQELAFSQIWSGRQSSLLHCEFTLEHVDPTRQFLICKIVAYQDTYYKHRQIFHIHSDKNESSISNIQTSKQRSSAIADSGIQLDPLQTVFRIPGHVRQRLCTFLDKPNALGNDWRMLAKYLKVDRYIMYFATKPSPTDCILDLWEARNREENALSDLKNSLRAMGRPDAAALFDQDTAWL